MKFAERKIESPIRYALNRGKSILLLGPRQTGKTTLVLEKFQPDILFNFAKAEQRMRYEKNLVQFERDLDFEVDRIGNNPLVFIDEVQKIPGVMDTVQTFIDDKRAQFMITGSSARKLKHGKGINLLPGRCVSFTLAPLVFTELPEPKPTLENLLIYGSLPHIITVDPTEDKETDLFSYASTYIEDEIRAEAAVRNVGHFSQFLEFEVKWSEAPGSQDARHIYKFLDEYSEANEGYIICRTPRRFKINKMITAIPWQDVSQLFTDK